MFHYFCFQLSFFNAFFDYLEFVPLPRVFFLVTKSP